jgi:hypothetical protein
LKKKKKNVLSCGGAEEYEQHGSRSHESRGSDRVAGLFLSVTDNGGGAGFVHDEKVISFSFFFLFPAFSLSLRYKLMKKRGLGTVSLLTSRFPAQGLFILGCAGAAMFLSLLLPLWIDRGALHCEADTAAMIWLSAVFSAAAIFSLVVMGVLSVQDYSVGHFAAGGVYFVCEGLFAAFVTASAAPPGCPLYSEAVLIVRAIFAGLSGTVGLIAMYLVIDYQMKEKKKKKNNTDVAGEFERSSVVVASDKEDQDLRPQVPKVVSVIALLQMLHGLLFCALVCTMGFEVAYRQ